MESIESQFIKSLSLSESSEALTVNEKCKAKFSTKNLKIFEDLSRFPIKLVSNVVKCSSSDLPKNLKIYGISALNLNKPEMILETKEIKKVIYELKTILQFQETMKEFFNSYQISGNTLFGETKNCEDLADYNFYVKSTENNMEFIKATKDRIISFTRCSEAEEANMPLGEAESESNKTTHYEISFKFSFPINEIQNPNFLQTLLALNKNKTKINENENFEKYKNSIITYCNIKTKDALKFLGYKRYDYTRNYAYFKDIHDNLRNKHNNYFYLENRSSPNGNSDIIMVPGINLSYNFYANGILMLRSITKYKMIREDTYYDLFDVMLKRNKAKFSQMAVGRYGFKTYKTKASEKFRIDAVAYIHPSEIPFENPNAEKDGIKTIYDYYRKNYPQCVIEKVEQPIFINVQKRKNRLTGLEVQIKNYLFAKFTYILGKLDTDQINLRPLTSLNAQEKFAQICQPLQELEFYRRNLLKNTQALKIKSSNINIQQPAAENDPQAKNLQLTLTQFNAKMLRDPQLQTNNKEPIALQSRGKRLCIDNIRAFEGNKSLGNWLLLGFGLRQSQLQKDFYQPLVCAAKTLNIEIELPIVICLEQHQIFTSSNKYNNENNDEIKDAIESVFFDIVEKNEKKPDAEKLDLLITALSEDLNGKAFYDLVKQSNFKSDLCLPAQNVNFQKLKKTGGNLSYFTCLLIQMFAKLSKPLWRFKSPKDLDNTVILSYSVKRDLNQKKTVAVLSVTLDKYFNDFIFVGEYAQSDTNIFYPEITNLIKKALKKLFKQQIDIDGNDSFLIENLIILREGVNESQKALCLSYELSAENLISIKNLIKEKRKKNHEAPPEAKLMVIFVNDRNDTKIFKNKNSEREKNSASGLEHFLQSGNPREIEAVEYADVGTLVDWESGITLSDKHFEFYVNSAFPTVGGSNFTRYTVVYDDTRLNEIVYALMYNLCFLYFNNPQPIKIPAPLQYAIRMNNYVISHLGFMPKKMDLTNFSL